MSLTTWNQIKQQLDSENQARREALQQDRCEHSQTRLVRYQTASEVLTARRQCLLCDDMVGGAVKKTEIEHFQSLPIVTCAEVERLRKERWERTTSVYAEGRENQNAAFWRFYNKYINSDAWRTKRQQAIQRAAGSCAGCNASLRSPIHVHHLTYDHLGDELLFELVVICERCHQKLHPHREIVAEGVAS